MKKQNTYTFLKYTCIFLCMNICYILFHGVLITHYNMISIVLSDSMSPDMYELDKNLWVFTYVAIIIPGLFFYLLLNNISRVFVFFCVFLLLAFKYFHLQPLIVSFIVICFSFSVFSCHVLLYLVCNKKFKSKVICTKSIIK